MDFKSIRGLGQVLEIIFCQEYSGSVVKTKI